MYVYMKQFEDPYSPYIVRYTNAKLRIAVGELKLM